MNRFSRFILGLFGVQFWTQKELDAAEFLSKEWEHQMKALFEDGVVQYDIRWSNHVQIFTIDIHQDGFLVESNFFDTSKECVDWAEIKYPGIEPL